MPTIRSPNVAVAVLALLALFFVATTDASYGTCYATASQPGPWCSSAYGRTCNISTGTTMFPLPSGETYSSFYSWILGILGTDGADVDMRYVDNVKTNPNIFFKAGQTGCYVNLTFVYEVASFRSQMGYFSFNKASPPTTTAGITSPLRLLFNETSVDCVLNADSNNINSCLSPGSTRLIGPYTSDQAVGFYLDRNQICNTKLARFYSIDALNKPVGWQRIPSIAGRLVAILRDPNTKRVYLSWEDFPDGSDEDYNDDMFSVTSNCELDYTKIPCAGVTTCRNSNQTFNSETCDCACANQPDSCPFAQTYDTNWCACKCPKTLTCPANQFFNSTTCACECPKTGSCSGLYQWNSSLSVCGCQCPSSYNCPQKGANNIPFEFDPATCTCNCPKSKPDSCTGNFVWNSANTNCSCYCPLTPAAAGVAACTGNLRWNTTVCGCQCPASPPTPCKTNEYWDTASCQCVCPASAPAGKECPNANYQWNVGGACNCSCPSVAPLDCSTVGTNFAWNKTVCNCACPPTGSCGSNPNVYWSTNPSTCGCQCPDTAQLAGVTCPTNQQWNNSRDACSCYCPATAQAALGKDCPNSFYQWNPTGSCSCVCPSSEPATAKCSSTGLGNFAWNQTTCGCSCPATPRVPCQGNLAWNQSSDANVCGCQCPATAQLAGVTCPTNQKWNNSRDSCSCYCPATAQDAIGKDCPNSFYQWNPTGSCSCVCPTSEPATAKCSSTGLHNFKWNSTTCGCQCPATPDVPCAGFLTWNQSSDADVCGCQCPATAQLAGTSCPGNQKWNNSRDSCECYCPAEAPESSPCTGNFIWNSTLSECDCYCPLTPPGGSCPGVQVWDRDFCQCVCPSEDPCFESNTQCKQYQCSEKDGQCALVYEDTCATQKAQFNTTGCLAWTCDKDLGCVRQAVGSCCGNYTDCPSCALADGCDWLAGAYCGDSGQVLTSPLDKADHPNCNPSSGLSAGETAGITVGIVAGVSVGVGGAAALLGAGYILYRLLNKPPAPEQLPTIENLDTEAGTDDNPLFHGSQIEMTNPMFSAAGAGGGGGNAPAMFATSGGAAPVPSDLHTL